jgi:hypothetical protein
LRGVRVRCQTDVPQQMWGKAARIDTGAFWFEDDQFQSSQKEPRFTVSRNEAVQSLCQMQIQIINMCHVIFRRFSRHLLDLIDLKDAKGQPAGRN